MKYGMAGLGGLGEQMRRDPDNYHAEAELPPSKPSCEHAAEAELPPAKTLCEHAAEPPQRVHAILKFAKIA